MRCWNQMISFADRFATGGNALHPKCAARSRKIDPGLDLGALYRRVHDRLRAHAVVKARHAGALIADRVDELERLVVAEGHERIARLRIARAAGPGPKFARH